MIPKSPVVTTSIKDKLTSLKPFEFKLVVFDMDGTIIKPASSWCYVNEKLGTDIYTNEAYKKFSLRQIDYQTFADQVTAYWKDTPLRKIHKIIGDIEYCDGIKTLVQKIQNSDVVIAIISTGLSVIADKIAKELKIKYVFSNDILHDGKVLNGKARVNVNMDGKIETLNSLLKKLKIKLNEVLAIGDSANDIPLFSNCGFSVAVNPQSPSVAKAANLAIGSLDELLAANWF